MSACPIHEQRRAQRRARAERTNEDARVLKLAQIPHLEGAVVGAGDHEVRHEAIPRDDVDVALVRSDRYHRPRRLANVPDADRVIRAARREDGRLRGRPLHVLDAGGVPCGERSVDRPVEGPVPLVPHAELAAAIARCVSEIA